MASKAPSEAHSEHTTMSQQSPLAQDIHTLTSGLARLEQPSLVLQRYAATDAKREDLAKLALGAKLDRALNRRMVGQDASFTKRISRVDAVGRTTVCGGDKQVTI